VIWSYITEAIGAGWTILQGLFDTFTALLTGNWSGLWDGLKKIASGAWDLLTAWWTMQKDLFIIVWGETWDGIKSAFSFVWDGLKGVASDAWDLLTGWWDGAWGIYSGIWSTAWDGLASAVTTAFDGVTGVISGILDSITDIFDGAVDKIKGVINGLIRSYNAIPIAPDIPLIGGSGSAGGGIGALIGGAVPFMAHGGTVLQRGLALVGERGPELLSLDRGARVTPLAPSSLGQGNSGGGGDTYIVLNGVDLSEGSRKVLEQIREGIRRLDMESA